LPRLLVDLGVGLSVRGSSRRWEGELGDFPNMEGELGEADFPNMEDELADFGVDGDLGEARLLVGAAG